MMKDPKVKTWASRLAQIYDRAARDKFMSEIPEEYRDAVIKLARNK